jgi:hypothetical protein
MPRLAPVTIATCGVLDILVASLMARSLADRIEEGTGKGIEEGIGKEAVVPYHTCVHVAPLCFHVPVTVYIGKVSGDT